MAAFDTFAAFNRALGERERQTLKEQEKRVWADLVAARSEEARLRIVREYLRDVHELLGQPRHA